MNKLKWSRYLILFSYIGNFSIVTTSKWYHRWQKWISFGIIQISCCLPNFQYDTFIFRFQGYLAIIFPLRLNKFSEPDFFLGLVFRVKLLHSKFRLDMLLLFIHELRLCCHRLCDVNLSTIINVPCEFYFNSLTVILFDQITNLIIQL